MAFKITQKPTFTARVKVETPNNTGGFDRSEFMAEFHRAGMDEIEELKKLPQREVLEKVLLGWSQLIDEDNQPVEFSEERRRALLNIPPALLALGAAFWESLFKAREKN
ncbi:hypothetical protein SAMN05216428_10176 [Nitrosospira sp. Nsp11]|uniref:hypothetical protein n=1 Tax=Nitrosospira sp. Nsp11 TaxID=1855338 RepID=UPI000912BB35|nr:hypothetical protein [Nitrosospira sp. Nsp11]SHL10148.1 hypothetical protein SAMN05216428_10176 [Nitrosospira sp. Nsp11]